MSSIQQRTGGCGTGAPGGNQSNAVQAGAACCEPSLPGRRLDRFVPAWLGGSRGMILGAIAVIGAGMAFGWPTLVALGLAPILLAILPCAAMCALGLCAMGKGRQTTPPQGSALQVPTVDRTPALLIAETDTAPPPNAREPATLS